MGEYYEDVYDGSRIFIWLSDFSGLPIDLVPTSVELHYKLCIFPNDEHTRLLDPEYFFWLTVNFLIAQAAALCLAGLFRGALRCASAEIRHTLCLVLGLLMGYFCFGKQAIHLAALPMICYFVLRTVSTQVMAKVVLSVSMFYLSCLHFHRQLYHTGGYTLDITGPLMVITQRVTSLAYSLHDGLLENTTDLKINTEKVTSDKMAPVTVPPTALEFFAFTLAFQTLMCGPVVFYNDYIAFIKCVPSPCKDKQLNGQPKAIVLEPSPRGAILYKLAGSLATAIIYWTLVQIYPVDTLRELTDPSSEVSRTWSMLYLVWFAYVSTLVVRCKYYHAWLLADAICNNSGIGFNGYHQGQAKWDKVSNIDIFGFEFADNFRNAVGSWNKNTNEWLRRVVYSRGGRLRTLRVYALSALWHGFHPGYYFTFSAGALCTVAARKIRQTVRPTFLQSSKLKPLYNVATFTATRIFMAYSTVPFILLDLQPSLAFYGRLYYSLHFIAFGALLIPVKSCSNKTQIELDAVATQLSLQTPSNQVENGTHLPNGKIKDA